MEAELELAIAAVAQAKKDVEVTKTQFEEAKQKLKNAEDRLARAQAEEFPVPNEPIEEQATSHNCKRSKIGTGLGGKALSKGGSKRHRKVRSFF
jgi:outer membrane protein TolC